MTLVEFLLAQYDEDEQMAIDAAASMRCRRWEIVSFMAERPWPSLINVRTKLWAVRTATEKHTVVISLREITPKVVGHIARHDPKRVLAEIEAKRRIIDEHPIEIDGVDEGEVGPAPTGMPSHSPRFGCGDLPR